MASELRIPFTREGPRVHWSAELQARGVATYLVYASLWA